MQPTEGNQAEPMPDGTGPDDPILQRVKDVSQKITERVRKLIGDTDGHGALASDPTDEAPSVP